MKLLSGLQIQPTVGASFIPSLGGVVAGMASVDVVSPARVLAAKERIRSRGPDSEDSVIAWELKQAFESADYMCLTVPGLGVARALAPNDGLYGKLVIVLNELDRVRLHQGGYSSAFLAKAVASASLVVGDPGSLELLVRSTPSALGKAAVPRDLLSSRDVSTFVAMRASHSVAAEERLQFMLAAERVVAFGRAALPQRGDAGGTRQILTFGLRGEEGTQLSVLQRDSSVDPAAHAIRVSGGTSQVAFQLRTLMEDLGGSSLVVDAVDLTRYCLKHAVLKHYSGILLTDSNAREFALDEVVGSHPFRGRSIILSATEEPRTLFEALTARRRANVRCWGSDFPIETASPLVSSDRSRPVRVLLATHDTKFAEPLMDELAAHSDFELRVDLWGDQYQNQPQQSRRHLEWADIVWCEFGTRNAVWYANRKRADQRMVVRVHGYEVTGPWLDGLDFDTVDHWIFVSEHLRDAGREKWRLDDRRMSVVPNAIHAANFHRQKFDNARFRIGLVGIIPMIKRADRALDLLENLLGVDERYTLHIRSAHPFDAGWVWGNREQRDVYESFYERIAANPALSSAIAFERTGTDMARWYRRVGWVLSPSSRESFHLAPVEGMASGAIPLVWNRVGAHDIFPAQYVFDSVASVAESVLRLNSKTELVDSAATECQTLASQFDVTTIFPRFITALSGEGL